MLLGLRDWDISTLHALYGDGASGVVRFTMILLSVLGSGWSLLALIPLGMNRRARRFAVDLLLTALVAAVAVTLLKDTFHRLRPSVALADVHALWDDPRDYSLPSGHATGSFVVAAFAAVALFRSHTSRLASIALSLFGFALAATIAVSRVYLGVHFPTDVISGAMLGTMIGLVGGTLHAKASSRGWPDPVEGLVRWFRGRAR